MNDREADGKVGGQLLDELFSALEDLETQSEGILQFLKDKGLATDQELAPYLDRAASASEVRWRAARLRMNALLAAAMKDAEEEFARKMEERNEPSSQKKEEPSASEQKAPTAEDDEDVKAPKQGQSVGAPAASQSKEGKPNQVEVQEDPKDAPESKAESKEEKRAA